MELIKNNAKEKKEWTVKRILTTAIIGVLALLMVGGSFYYVFSPGFSKKSQAWGFYKGEPILYDSNNVFARTLMADETYEQAAATGDFNGMYNSLYTAYQSQVIYVALSQLANKAGITAPQELVDKYIVDSGVFNNDEGVFDKTIYDSVSEADKRYFNSYAKSIYPYQTVLADLYSNLTPSKEAEFIAEYAGNARTFDYFIVGSTNYPDALAKEYVNSNKDDFKILDLSMISCTSQEQATMCHTELVAGMSWEDAVAKYSADSYAENDGKIGQAIFAALLKSNLKNEDDLSKLLNLQVDGFTAPIEGTYAWTIYKLDSKIEDANLNDDSTLANVKQYIYNNDKDAVQTYIDEAAAKASELAKTNFDEAAEIYGYGVATVGPVSNNIGGSSLFYGIEAFDSNGYLATAVSEDDYLASDMYAEGVGFVTDAIETTDGYLIARVSADSYNEDLKNITNQLYGYYQAQIGVVDFENSVLTSEDHEDNFVTKFIDTYMNSVSTISME